MPEIEIMNSQLLVELSASKIVPEKAIHDTSAVAAQIATDCMPAGLDLTITLHPEGKWVIAADRVGPFGPDADVLFYALWDSTVRWLYRNGIADGMRFNVAWKAVAI